jgi:signal transduction histidine kinase
MGYGENMKRITATMALVAALVLPAVAQTRDQAKAIVKQAVDFAKKNPKDKFLEEVSGVKGQFHFTKGQNNDLYIFVYDLEGKVLAHGVRRELVGVNRWTAKDPDGKSWIQDWTKLAKEKGSGWIEYKELNPAQNNKIMKKASWVELVNGMVIGAGIYE